MSGMETPRPGVHYLFRGDDAYRSGPIGRALGDEADEAEIQDFAEHVLRKEANRSSRYTSFTTETRIARRFTSAPDNRHVRKVDTSRLLELQGLGGLRIWDAEGVDSALKQGPRRLARLAADVRAAMERNREILIEGQIPADAIERAH